jgi:hypothetical protein
MARVFIRAVLIVLVVVVWGAPSLAQTEIKSEFRTIPPVPSISLVNGIYYVTLDAPTPRSWISAWCGAALRHSEGRRAMEALDP